MKKIPSYLTAMAKSKKTLIVLSLVLLSPLFTNAATLNNTFTVSNYFPNPGSMISVSSSCGNSGSNSTVSFSILQNGNNTPLLTSISSDATGIFSGNILLPSPFTAGSATLVATCNKTGDTINSPVLTITQVASASFGLPSYIPNSGGILNISGSCGSSNGIGSAQVNLLNNGTSYSLSNFNLDSMGSFSGTVLLPNNLSNSAGTLNAVCSNGNLFSSQIYLNSSVFNALNLGNGSFPGYSKVTGNCTNVPSNQNGTVTFSVLRNQTITNLNATGNTTNNTGNFSSSVFFPASLGSAPATFIVTCPNSSTFSNVIMLGDPVITPNPVVTTPVGGVNAGFGSQD
jgi:hypothetical protein